MDKNSGEIYIQLQKARIDAKNHNMSYNKFIYLLFIHGCLHLCGHDHCDAMDKLEDKYLSLYYIDKNETKYKTKLDRSRHWY